MPKNLVMAGIPITVFRNLRVSKNYRWHEEDREFEDLRTGVRRNDSEYEAKVDVYEDRVRTWFLDWAAKLVHTDLVDSGTSPGDYVALSVALAYLEGVSQYRLGEESGLGPGDLFRASATRILPSASVDAITMLWKKTRCGLFHSGFTEDRVYVSHENYTEVLELTDDGELHIDPARFVQLVLEDFEGYVQELRAKPSGELAQQFEKLWDMRWASS